MTNSQRALIFVLLTELTITSREDQLRTLSHLCSRELESRGEVTFDEAKTVLNHLTAVKDWPEKDQLAEVNKLTRPVADPWKKAS